MNLWMNAVIDSIALIIIFMLYFNNKRYINKDYNQSLFNNLLVSVSIILFAELITWCIDGKVFPFCQQLQMILTNTIYIVEVFYGFVWIIYTSYWIYGSKERIKKRLFIYAIPLMAEIGLMIINVFTGFIFIFNAQNEYIRGDYFMLYSVFYCVYSVAATYMTAKEFLLSKNKERKTSCIYLASFMILPEIAGCIQMFVYGVSLIAPSIALSLLLVYLNVHQRLLIEEKLKVANREAELQQANISIMLSQIQPHFLYNALCVIQDLCYGKAPEAEETTIEFSRYLRGNLDSLSAKKPIAFSHELEHTQNYLALEKKRFLNRLNVEYNINTTDFFIPALTLQPIVENAVRYGICQKAEGGTVVIKTEENENNYIITVSDNGVGFDMSVQKNDGRSHIGISNVRERLQKMSGGSLQITSTVGTGTTAVITLPKKVNV